MNKLLKQAVMFLLVLSTILLAVPSYATQDEIKILLDGDQLALDMSPQIVNGRVLLPMRAIFEALGASVEWDDKTKTVTGTNGDIKIVLTIDSTKAYVNGIELTLAVPAMIIDNRSMVPLRIIAESFGIDVSWDEKTRTVRIISTTPKSVQTEEPTPVPTVEPTPSTSPTYTEVYRFDFEQDPNNNGWVTVSNPNKTSLGGSWCKTKYHSSTYSVEIIANNSAGNLRKIIPIENGKTYRILAWIASENLKTNNADSLGFFAIAQLDSNNNVIVGTLKESKWNIEQDWTEYYFSSIKILDSAASIGIYFGINGTGSAWLDDVCLEVES